MVIGALHVDRDAKAALPLGDVIGDVRHEIGERAVGLAHHAVLVVAVVGRAQPQRAVFLVGLAAGDERVDRRVDLAVGVEARLQVVDVEAHAELLQVEVLLVPQVRDREAPHGVQVVDLAARLDRLAVERVHGLLREEVVGDVLDVLAVVGRSPASPARRA